MEKYYHFKRTRKMLRLVKIDSSFARGIWQLRLAEENTHLLLKGANAHKLKQIVFYINCLMGQIQGHVI